MKWSEAESQWKERERERQSEWVKNGPTVETASLSIPCLKRREKHPHTHQYDERPSPKPYMEKSRFFFSPFFVVFLICLFAVQEEKKKLKTNETIKKKKSSRFTINVGGENELQKFGWVSGVLGAVWLGCPQRCLHWNPAGRRWVEQSFMMLCALARWGLAVLTVTWERTTQH